MITPTTAAVMADNAAVTDSRPRRNSIYGAPRKTHRMLGINVTYVTTSDPKTPATN